MVRIRQDGEYIVHVIIMNDLKEETLELEATVKEWEDNNKASQADLDAR